MADRRQVKCINKTHRMDPHDRIQNIGGTNADGSSWKKSQPDAIHAIESGAMSFYVSAAGRTAEVIVATHNGRKYLKTTADGIHPDNLLALPECPA